MRRFTNRFSGDGRLRESNHGGGVSPRRCPDRHIYVLSDNNFIGSNFKFAQTCSSILLLKDLRIPYGVGHTANKKTTTCGNCSLTRG